jgi:hypothetical protein
MRTIPGSERVIRTFIELITAYGYQVLLLMSYTYQWYPTWICVRKGIREDALGDG